MANKGADGDSSAEPFLYTSTRHADFKIADALRFLGGSPGGTEAMERFSERSDEVIKVLCQSVAREIADTGRYHKRVDIPASAYYTRPIYRLDLQTTKKRTRRSGSGLSHIYQAAADVNNDGTPETIVIVPVEHSGSQPFVINTGQSDADAEDHGE
ncbi:MAG: hypothetical protein H7145_21215 [Akkermansiaceae bacterium]|nr:hypothetical protein [Armatimonadota bacterium]